MIDALALWQLLLAEALLLVAAGLALLGLDDVMVDLAWLWLALRRQLPPVQEVPASTPLPPGGFAVFVPAWDESAVIGAMLALLRQRWGDTDYRVFVGLYPNDAAGLAVVAALADAHVQPVVNVAPGPTTKADCLNQCWQAMLAVEAARGKAFAAVVLHDAEDVVPAGELALFALHLADHAMVQVPVRPLPDAASPLVAGHYIDEFAQNHGKALPVRQAMGAALPSAGVGTAINRTLLAHIAEGQGGAPFDAGTLTEDYELGHRLAALGGRACFVQGRHLGMPIRVEEHFPAEINTAVRQKARWLVGIALAGWDRLGWRGSWANRWWLWRDRKGPLAALLALAGYALVLLLGLDWLAGRWLPLPGLPLERPLLVLLWLNWGLLLWRLGWRAWWTARAENWGEAALAMPRAMVGNLVNALAAGQALKRYLAVLGGGRLVWDKTRHRFPGQ
ncbi:MAG: glycosyl transferase family protein [Sphingomonadales bacterium]|jgi:adsorption protein B